MLDLLLRLNRERGVTLIVVTHDPEVAEHMERIIHIRDGLIEKETYPQAQRAEVAR